MLKSDFQIEFLKIVINDVKNSVMNTIKEC